MHFGADEDIVFVGEDEPLPEDLLFEDEGGDGQEPQDETIYEDYGPGDGGRSGGGGGGGGGGGAPEPVPYAPAASIAPAVAVTPAPAMAVAVTPQPAVFRKPTIPVTGGGTTPVVLAPYVAAKAAPPQLPVEIRNAVQKLQAGTATVSDVKTAAKAAAAAGMPTAAAKLTAMISPGAKLQPNGPRPETTTTPAAMTQAVQKLQAGTATVSDVKKAAVAASAANMPAVAAKLTAMAASAAAPRTASARTVTRTTLAPKARTTFRGLEEDMNRFGSTLVSDESNLFAGLDDAADDFMQGQDAYADSSIAPEGQIPGYEMDESGEYVDEGAAPDIMPSEGYGPLPPSYGYPQQAPSPLPGAPYGYDSYAAQGYAPAPLPGAPYGYDPYAQQQPGYGYDPYAQQQPPAQDVTSMFPVGTPQSIIDAAVAIQNGTATLQQIQQAVKDASSMGMSAVANQLLAMYQAAGGQYTAGGGATGAQSRYCNPGEVPQPGVCRARAEDLPVCVSGQPIPPGGCRSGAAATSGYAAAMKKLGPAPTTPAACKDEAKRIYVTPQFTSAIKKQKTKAALTDDEKAYFVRYYNAMKCSGIAAACSPGGHPGMLTDEQKACRCKQSGKNVVCPVPGQTVAAPEEALAKKFDQSITKRQLAVIARQKLASVLMKAGKTSDAKGHASNAKTLKTIRGTAGYFAKLDEQAPTGSYTKVMRSIDAYAKCGFAVGKCFSSLNMTWYQAGIADKHNI